MKYETILEIDLKKLKNNINKLIKSYNEYKTIIPRLTVVKGQKLSSSHFMGVWRVFDLNFFCVHNFIFLVLAKFF